MNNADREILEHFTRTREKSIALLQEVPCPWLSRTATGEENSLGQLFAHIASAVDFWMERCMHDSGQAALVDEGDKASLIKSLEASRDRLVRFFSREDGVAMQYTFVRPTGTRADVFRDSENVERFSGRDRVLYLTQHEAHHRGKIVLALRQWGFVDIPFLPY